MDVWWLDCLSCCVALGELDCSTKCLQVSSKKKLLLVCLSLSNPSCIFTHPSVSIFFVYRVLHVCKLMHKNRFATVTVSGFTDCHINARTTKSDVNIFRVAVMWNDNRNVKRNMNALLLNRAGTRNNYVQLRSTNKKNTKNAEHPRHTINTMQPVKYCWINVTSDTLTSSVARSIFRRVQN